MASPALLFAGASAAMDLMGGLFGYLASQEASGIAESRGRMLRMEADADATRYAEQARKFQASQRTAYTKSGVLLSGSPLAVLAEDALTASENISAIQARGLASQVEQEAMAGQVRNQGRTALLSGISSGMGRIAQAAYFGG